MKRWTTVLRLACHLTLLLLCLIWSAMVRAQDISTPAIQQQRLTSITGLCADDPGAGPSQALARLVGHGVAGNPLERAWAQRVIAAIRNAALLCPPSGTPVLADTAQQIDAVSLLAVSSLPAELVYVPNMLVRRKLAVAAAELNLFSSTLADREQAAAQVDKFYALLDSDIINAALAREKDAQVHATLTLAMAKRGLESASIDERRRAIDIVASVPSLASRTLLANVLATAAPTDTYLIGAASAGIRTIDQWLMLGKICSVLFSGLSYAGILLLTALGLSIVFGLMGVINLAHGEFIMVGAYATYVVEQLMQAYLPAFFGAYIFVAIPCAFIVCALFGMLLEFCVIRFLYRRPLETLLATWAVSIATIKLVQLVFGSQNLEFISPGFLNGGTQVFAGFFVTYNRIFAILLALAIFGATLLLIRHTRFGLLIRATTQRRDTARSLGVAAEKIDRLAFGLGAGLAGLAGVVLTQIASVNPSMGTSFVIDAFMVVVLGGAGSLVGTAISSLALGEINQIIEPLYGAVAAKVAILLLIVIIIQRRPQGLFASKTRV
jgi:urea transport system permease protein